MKKNTNTIIAEAKKLSSRMPKTINESLNFNEMPREDNDMEMDDDEPIHNEPIEQGHNSEANPLNVENFINDTRKRALQIMAKLAEDPENPIYDISKRIWQICDKAYNDQKEGNGLAQQQQIHQQQQHNNI